MSNLQPAMSRYQVLKGLLLAAPLLPLSDPVAAEWLQVGRAVDATTFYDKESIRKVGTGVKMWSLTNFTSVELIEGKYHQSVKAQYEYDCAGERYRLLATIFYAGRNGKGKVTASDALAEGWNPIAPKTMAEQLLRLACTP